MRQSKNVYTFKNELRNYDFYLERIKGIDEMIEYCYHMLGGVRAIDTSKEPVHGGAHNLDAEYRIREEIEHHEANKRYTQRKVDEMDKVLNKIDLIDREPIIAVYVKGNSIEKVSRKMFLSSSALGKRMDKALSKLLDTEK